MNRFVLLSCTGAFLMNAAILNSARAADTASDNPLLQESTLPYQFPPFDKIKNEHFQPAIEQGMAEQLKEVEAIADQKDKPSFENTIVAMEKSGRLLTRANRTFSNLNGCNTNPEMQRIDKELSPKLAAHQDAIRLKGPLFKRIETLYNDREKLKLDPESKWLLERYYKDFVRAGAKLNDADKTKLKEMNQEIAKLQTTFEQNVLKEKNASSIVVDSREELDGMADGAIAAAEKAAKEDGKEGKFVLRLQNTTQQPPLKDLKDRALRQRIMEVSLNRNSHGGEFDNREVVSRIAKLRAERAVLLGYENHAAYQLEDQTAKNVPTVNKMLGDVTPPAVANARKEIADMQKVIDSQGDKFKLESWDWDFYSEQVRKAKYAFDESQLRPYLELNRVITEGVFYAANKEYGITFKERKDLPVYLPDIRVWEVFNADGSPLAIFIGDYYARPSKRGGAWASAYVGQNKLLGTKTVIGNHLNIPKPPEGQPTLLTWDEVRTAFHEFGHALHGMFSDVEYPRFGGTGVPRDFVEYPSQVNEMWKDWPDILANYAKHYQTGEPMPKELLDKVIAAEKFNQGYRTTEYLSATLLDQAWHQMKPEQVPSDTLGFEAQALKKAGTDLPEVPPRYRSTYFSHTFSGGYSAGYYSYLWSEVLDADTVDWFKSHGGLTRENGDRFRKTLLSRGGSDDAMNLFRNMVGHDPDIKPLLKRRGLEITPVNEIAPPPSAH
ncbi:MAG: M3 family metallopeptidase [Chthoniobacterales bacterium]